MVVNLRRFLQTGLFFWLTLAAVGVYFLLPLRQKLKFGIDLVGGTYITLKVDTSEAINAELASKMRSFPEKLKADKLAEPKSKKIKDNEIHLTFDNPDEAYSASEFLRGEEPSLRVHLEDNVVKFSYPERIAENIRTDAVSRNVEVLRTRLDNASVAEVNITRQGTDRIVVELPDVSNTRQARAMIGKAAMLEIKLVEKAAGSEEEIRDAYDGEIPEDMTIVKGKRRGGVREFYLLPSYTDLTGKLLKDASVGFDGKVGIEPVVNFEFNNEGGEKFYQLTSRYQGRQLAIVIDNEVISAPSVNSPIRSRGMIYGGFTPEGAKELATLLKSGAFQAPVTFAEERQISALLGEDSIKKGLFSCLIGLILLFIFSLFYYKLPGLFAFSALLYNMVLVLLALAYLKATLTLPGIAGLVLTVGMAIDASVLIYERVKEELAGGMDLNKAVNSGFSGAMAVILDANITTLIVGVVLFKFGAGPIQGFAATMIIGILATLVSGLFYLRSIFTFLTTRLGVRKITF